MLSYLRVYASSMCAGRQLDTFLDIRGSVNILCVTHSHQIQTNMQHPARIEDTESDHRSSYVAAEANIACTECFQIIIKLFSKKYYFEMIIL